MNKEYKEGYQQGYEIAMFYLDLLSNELGCGDRDIYCNEIIHNFLSLMNEKMLDTLEDM